MQRCIECGSPFAVGAPFCDRHNRLLYGVYVAESKIPHAGNGLFAARFFKKHEAICPWEGEIQPLDTFLSADEDEYALWTPTHIINPFKHMNLASMANTAASKDGTRSVRKGCNSENVGRKVGDPWLVATKRIETDEEILCF